MENKQSIHELLKTGKRAELISSETVAERFQNLYSIIHGISAKDAKAFYETEKFHFLKLLNDNPKIKNCTPLSLYGVFLDVAVNGLSFDPAMKQVYVVPFNHNVGTKDAKRWEARAILMISPYGELHLRQVQGSIKYADNPVIVYDNEPCKIYSKDDCFKVEHERVLPQTSTNMVACYLKLTRPDNTIDYKVMTFTDLMYLKEFSKDKTSLAWTSGLKGMFEAKTIKHAFKNYPKLRRIGKFSTVQSIATAGEDNLEMEFDYGVDIETGEVIETENVQPAQQAIPAAPLNTAVPTFEQAHKVNPVPVATSNTFTFQQPNF